jgi:hypothetical protein
MSANVCRIVHLLRAAGPELETEALQDFDERQAQALGCILGGPLSDLCSARAACAARDGGLGLRRSLDLRFPAFLASRTEARSLAEELAQGLPVDWQDALFGHWGESTAAALASWSQELPPATAVVAAQILAEGDALADRRSAQLAGRLPRDRNDDGASYAQRVSAALLAPAGLEDPEHPDAPSNGLQARLADLLTHERLAEVEASLRSAGDWEGVHLLADLRHSGTDHSWLWVLAAADATVLRPTEFVTAVRLRLGAAILDGPGECARCGAVLDPECRHALRCAPGPATRGHNRLRDTLLGVASLGDGAAATEVRGLVPSAPALRPADLLTVAAFGRVAALDVVVACPASEGAGVDACAAAVARKLRTYGPYLEELAREGVEYRPLAWTCWGRPHTDAEAALRSMAQAAARRQGAVNAQDLDRRARSAVGVQICHRAAKMVEARRPTLNQEDAALILPESVARARQRQGRPPERSCPSSRSSSSTSSSNRARSSAGGVSAPAHDDAAAMAMGPAASASSSGSSAHPPPALDAPDTLPPTAAAASSSGYSAHPPPALDAPRVVRGDGPECNEDWPLASSPPHRAPHAPTPVLLPDHFSTSLQVGGAQGVGCPGAAGSGCYGDDAVEDVSQQAATGEG